MTVESFFIKFGGGALVEVRAITGIVQLYVSDAKDISAVRHCVTVMRQCV